MVRARLSVPSSAIRPLPVRLLFAALILTITLLAALGWSVSTAYRNLQAAHATDVQLEASCVEIAYLDEVLPMSAYVAAATGDLWWEHRYRRFDLRLRAAVQKAEGLAAGPFLTPVAARTDAAGVALRRMENRSLELVRQGDRAAALAVLSGGAYKKQRSAHAKGRQELTAQVRGLLRAAARERRREARYALVSTGVSLPLLVLIWLGVVRTVRVYVAERRRSEQILEHTREELEWRVRERTEELHRANQELQAEIAERNQAEEALREARAKLEERVKERTAELLGANTSLKAEIQRRERAEEELHAAKEAAESASRAKSDFLASMSHELRTPLNAIIGFSQILKEQHFGQLNEPQADYVNDVLESGQHLLLLINDILDLSKIEAGKMTLNLSRVNLPRLLERSTAMIKEKCLKHQIHLAVNVPDALRDLEIAADERKVKQLVFNLLSNAGKFTPDGGRIAVDLRQQDRAVVVCVSDTGIGIPLEEQGKIFEEFYQTSDGSAAKAPGTGLGLSLVKRLAQLHGGKVWVESEGRDQGSRFSVSLPMAAPPAEEDEAGAEAPPVNVISRVDDLRRRLAVLIEQSKASNRPLTLCLLRTRPELSRTEAVRVAREFQKEKRPDDYLGVDWTGQMYLIFRGVDAERAKIPCGRMTGRATGALVQVEVTWLRATFPEDGRTADALLGKLGLGSAGERESGERVGADVQQRSRGGPVPRPDSARDSSKGRPRSEGGLQ